MQRLQSDALALEYKRYYGHVRGNLELRDVVNYPPLAREFGRLGLLLPEKSFNLVLWDSGALRDNAADALLRRP